ncbi:hypothetical protein [Carboxylicivirga sp. N1Y90]|uniref:hypothetical protein n=1 Tax=Carboxylicivirga fragile TaxID=3417571 RepID=UPI003D349720|nr:hypothetical protein [Marinilabiliaceae bacterium N1Y90]
MRKFYIKIVVFGTALVIPLLVFIGLYIHFDPFKIVGEYDTFYDTEIVPNRDYISTEIFLDQKYDYNSFIFGSSRAIAFKARSWEKYLDENAKPFVFDASGESLFGIYKKIKFLEKRGTNLDNVFILFCRNGVCINDNYDEHLNIKHPLVSEESWFKFHFTFFKSYFELKFLLGYYSYMITGQESALTSGIIQDGGISIDYENNQILLDTLDLQINSNTAKYYKENRHIFYEQENESYEEEQKLQASHIEMLKEIKEILERNNTKYKVVLSPIYDQVKFSPEDKSSLKMVFGDHLYDFTGENFITSDYTNWYETFHYRPFIADSIMNIVYSDTIDVKQWR